MNASANPEIGSVPLNVLWLTCDEMKASAVSVYGHPRTQMPAFERMAREGALFENAFVQMPKCVPSRCSMMTGRYPHTDGFRTLRGRTDLPKHPEVDTNDLVALTEGVPNLVSRLREEGYKTCLLGKNHLVEWNLHKKWFDKTPSWDWDRPKMVEPVSPELRRADYVGRIDPESIDPERFADAVSAREFGEFLDEQSGYPFFAVVDLGKPHPPYDEYPWYPSADIPLEEIELDPVLPLEEAPSVEQAIRRSKGLEGLSDEDRKKVLRAYWTMCEFADDQVGKILRHLDERGLAENTLVILTADHGDFATERACYEKWDTAFYECITRVPLLMRLPGKIPAGKRFAQLTELVDLLPTTLDFAGYEAGWWVHGRSVGPLIRGETDQHKEAVFCQGGVERPLIERVYEPTDRPTPVKQQVALDYPVAMLRAKMVRTERWKYVLRLEGDSELYDLKTDPGERRNRIHDPDCQGILGELKDHLLRFMLEYETDRPEVHSLFA